ncbi:hypothetical protein [Streptomyces sp. SBT349]|uniref:hypothetical protein n=1 Tax=Streptomyces sp. SBT349 TaxID=1580539 RepID=UPI00131EB9D9|nr:hypothetical protein [Streptomyces sp. SBT349]
MTKTVLTRRCAWIGVAVAGVVALSGCGDDGGEESPFANGGDTTGGSEEETTEGGGGGGEGSITDLSGAEILQQASEAMASADSMRLATEGGPATDGFGVDLHLDRAGDCAGTISQAGQGQVEILKRGEEVWMKPDTQFWQTMGAAEPALVSMLDGSYLYGTTADPELSAMADTCSLDAFIGEGIEAEEGEGDTAETGEESTHNGTPVILVHGTDADGAENTALIATEGEPYPLLMTVTQDGATTEMELSNYNEPVAFEDPPADQVLNIADFRSGNVTA